MTSKISFRAMFAAAATLLAASTQTAFAADAITLITDFGYNGRHAYFFVAQEKGYYKDAGIDIKIVGGKGSVDAIRQVAAGNAKFGFADAGSLVLSRANDNIPIKLVAVVYARPPQAIFCAAEAGLKTPKDLEGKSIANPAGGSIPDMFPAFAKAAGIDASKVNWVVAASSALPGLLASGKVPCVGQFTVGEPLLRAQAAPKKLVRFAYSDPGLNYYGNGLIATEETIKSNPDLVRRFVAATVKGLKAAIANPAEAGAIMHKYHPEVSEEVGKGETESVAELAQVKGKPLAEIDPAGIQATIDVVNGAFKLKSQVKATDVYVPGFVPK
ncbi:MAG TPA: ABC transporter substrate-binding protein [Pseudolabrys sp.]|nr:ABC transporter substrate-binding protein [Pseudolabrys sp.]